MTRRQTSGASSQVVRVAAGDAGVVDEDVDAADAPAIAARSPRRPTVSSVSSTTSGAHRAERWPSVLLASREPVAVDVPQHDGGARGEHALGDGVADALRAAGDDRDAALRDRSGSWQQSLQRRGAAPAPRAVGDVLADDVGEVRVGSQAEPRRALRGRAARPVGDDAGDDLVALEAHPRAHRRPATASSASSISRDACVDRRQVQREAAAERSRLAS